MSRGMLGSVGSQVKLNFVHRKLARGWQEQLKQAVATCALVLVS